MTTRYSPGWARTFMPLVRCWNSGEAAALRPAYVGRSALPAGVAMGWDEAEMDRRIRAAFVTSSPLDDIAFPLIATQIYKFIAPGLYKHEKKAILPFLVASPVLFVLGASLVYFFFTPMVMWFFLAMQQTGGDAAGPVQPPQETVVGIQPRRRQRLIDVVRRDQLPPVPTSPVQEQLAQPRHVAAGELDRAAEPNVSGLVDALGLIVERLAAQRRDQALHHIGVAGHPARSGDDIGEVIGGGAVVLGNFFAHDENIFVPDYFLAERLVQRIEPGAVQQVERPAHRLAVGDSLHLKSQIPHTLHNDTDGVTVVVSVVTPRLF